MLRCEALPGQYEVAFKYLESDGTEREAEYYATLAPHEDIMAIINGAYQVAEPRPRASRYHPYVGELCAHELDWLKSLPGKQFSAHWRFTATEVI